MVVGNIVQSPAEYALIKLSGKEIRSILKECNSLSKPRKRRESEKNDKKDGDKNCDDNNCDDDDCDEDDCDVQGAEDMWSIIFPGTSSFSGHFINSLFKL